MNYLATGGILRRFTIGLVLLLVVATGTFKSKAFSGPQGYWPLQGGDGEISGGEINGGGESGGGPIADASATSYVTISPNGLNAVVTLDGSRSRYATGLPLFYSWSLTGSESVIATSAVSRVTLPIGTNSITLTVVNSGEFATASVSIEVIGAGTAVERLIMALSESDLQRNKQPLLATLSAAKLSFDHRNFTAGLNELSTFQNKVRAQLEHSNPALATDLIEAAQQIAAVFKN